MGETVMNDDKSSKQPKWTFSMDLKWLDNSYLKIEHISKDSVCLLSNRQGLLSFSKQIKQIICKRIPVVLYDEYPGDLEEGSWSMTLKFLLEDAPHPHISSICKGCPAIELQRTTNTISMKWRDTDFFIITKEGNRGLQIMGNKSGLESFSNHLYTISQSSISFVSYEQPKDYPNNYLTSFSVKIIDCSGR